MQRYTEGAHREGPALRDESGGSFFNWCLTPILLALIPPLSVKSRSQTCSRGFAMHKQARRDPGGISIESFREIRALRG